MNVPIKPIYLFADSQLLFWKSDGHLFLETLKDHLAAADPKAAYIGAANGDNPEFFEIFKSAMEGIGITNCRMIQSQFSAADHDYLAEADLILLAGGELKRGWDILVKTGMRDLVIKKYYAGATLIGISAGAVQLCLGGWADGDMFVDNFIYTFKLTPLLLGTHEEKEDWRRLRKSVRVMGNRIKAIGVSAGGGLIYYPDHTLEPIRFPVHEFVVKNNKLVYCLVYPPTGNERECTEELMMLH
ncbi:MAG: Type 1 glutamine amidotransferase-like domain-containing protein [candidate division KSB1 bacterium]|nr:Type 1 glutamine amidotransferase-like domain-containing protein [candidate division KSB1 bacterium]MDZ7318861.1 Type 1 glutamine amidotransferase-like domain-containing protein [candidate division KSB1 bacterium]MDZ7339746.1 Type 1 glutamine amidotransferase-like domain-containing protein [candidate division KSB1 bacterium]